VFSSLVAKNYGRAELTLLDHVKRANPEVLSIDELRAGQRLRLPTYEPGKVVQKGDTNGYRLHLLTTWDPKSPVLDKLKPAVSKLGRQVFVVPVSLTPNETAYRVLVGEFPDRRDAEAFARDFRMPPGMSSQLWR